MKGRLCVTRKKILLWKKELAVDGWRLAVGDLKPAHYGLFRYSGARTAAPHLFGDAVFFALRAQDAIHGIRGAAAGFVVVADLHLAEQPNGQHIQAAQQQTESRHHERTVIGHDGDMA
jgi:hypothetical protein